MSPSDRIRPAVVILGVFLAAAIALLELDLLAFGGEAGMFVVLGSWFACVVGGLILGAWAQGRFRWLALCVVVSPFLSATPLKVYSFVWRYQDELRDFCTRRIIWEEEEAAWCLRGWQGRVEWNGTKWHRTVSFTHIGTNVITYIHAPSGTRLTAEGQPPRHVFGPWYYWVN